MSDLFEEISEELKQENIHKMWQKYGGVVLTAIFLIITGTAGFVGWEHYVETKRIESSERYFEAVESNSFEKLVAIDKKHNNGFAALAIFKKAEVLASEGRKPEALSVYKELAKEFSENKGISDAALLLSSYKLLRYQEREEKRALKESSEPSTKFKNEAKRVLTELSSPDNIFYFSAREMLGVLALEEGDNETANKIFEELANDVMAPPSMKARLKKLLKTSNS